MKLLLPVFPALLLFSCAAPMPPPKPGTAAHQVLLEKQAKENFYAMKERERERFPQRRVAQAPPAEKVRLKPFQPAPAPRLTRQVAPKPTPKRELRPFASINLFGLKTSTGNPKPKLLANRKPVAPPKVPAKPAAKKEPVTRVERVAKTARKTPPPGGYVHTRKDDGTQYFYDVPRGPEPNTPRYLAYKARVARELNKRPEDLTATERDWVRRHYRE